MVLAGGHRRAGDPWAVPLEHPRSAPRRGHGEAPHRCAPARGARRSVAGARLDRRRVARRAAAPTLAAPVSSAVVLSRASQRAGISLRGAHFWVTSEPMTTTRRSKPAVPPWTGATARWSQDAWRWAAWRHAL